MNVGIAAKCCQNGNDSTHGLGDESGRPVQVFSDNVDQIVQSLNGGVEWGIRKAGPSY